MFEQFLIKVIKLDKILDKSSNFPKKLCNFLNSHFGQFFLHAVEIGQMFLFPVEKKIE